MTQRYNFSKSVALKPYNIFHRNEIKMYYPRNICYSKRMAFAGWIWDTRKLGTIKADTQMTNVATLMAAT